MLKFILFIAFGVLISLFAPTLFAQNFNLYTTHESITPDLKLPIGHTGLINAISFRPDGKRIATASIDRTAKIWDVASGKLLLDLDVSNFKNMVNDITYSHDSKLLATASGNIIKLWDANSGNLIDSLKSSNGSDITQVYFSKNDSIIYAKGGVVDAWDRYSNLFILKKIKCTFPDNEWEFNNNTTKLLVKPTTHSIAVYNAINGNIEVEIPDIDSLSQKVYFGKSDTVISFLNQYQQIVFYSIDSNHIPIKLKGLPDSLNNQYKDYKYSPDHNTIVLVGYGKTLVLDAQTFSIIRKFDKFQFEDVQISADNTYYVFRNIDSSLFVWNRLTDHILSYRNPDNTKFDVTEFSPDNKKLFTLTGLNNSQIWDLETGVVTVNFQMFGNVVPLIKSFFSNDGKRIIQIKDSGVVEIWGANNLKKLIEIKGNPIRNRSDKLALYPIFTNDGKQMAEIYADTIIRIWDLDYNSQKISVTSKFNFNSFQFNNLNTEILTSDISGSVKIWDLSNGKLLKEIQIPQKAEIVRFTPDDKNILVSAKGMIQSINIEKDSINFKIPLPTDSVYSLIINLVGNKLGVMKIGDSCFQIYDLYKGNRLNYFHSNAKFYSLSFSEDGNRVVTYADSDSSKVNFNTIVWDLKDTLSNKSFNYFISQRLTNYSKTISIDLDNSHLTQYALIKNPQFSPDGKSLLALDDKENSVLDLWQIDEPESSRLKLRGHQRRILSASFSKDGKYILTSSSDNTSKFWDAKTGKLLFTILGLGKSDYLVLDKFQRFDGTDQAKKMLYVTCGDEVIDLEQFEDLCWEVDLVPKTLENRSIAAKKLNDIQLCNVIPKVREIGKTPKGYQFCVYPGEGGIGSIEVYVGNKMVKSYQPDALVKVGVELQLNVDDSIVFPYLKSGVPNRIYIKALTKDNSIISRGPPTISKVEGKINNSPHLYLVSIGINVYSGNNLKSLKYSESDAISFAKTLAASSRILLNGKDSVDHVHSFVFTTNPSSVYLPLKDSIKSKLSEIKKLAKPEDILVIFFSGHGVLDTSENKQLFLLTQEAKSFDMNNPDERKLAISSSELSEWLRNIKIGNQVLVLDACQSGQFLKDYTILDNLHHKTGTFILSGAASTESAYETTSFSHGLMTYSLLLNIKNGINLKENGSLDVSSWFNDATSSVQELARSIGKIQNPQILETQSFKIGIVNRSVMDSIQINVKKIIGASDIVSLLPNQTPLAANFKDSLDAKLIIKTKEVKDHAIDFNESSKSVDLYKFNLTYKEENGIIILQGSLLKGNNSIEIIDIKKPTKQKDRLLDMLVKDALDKILK